MNFKILLSFFILSTGLESFTAAPAICPVSAAGCNLRCTMNKLWSDHVFWTRLYIIGALDNKKDLQATTNRLMKNQEDIGNAIASYYGKEAGEELTKLLKEHISIAADVVKAVKLSGKKKRSKKVDPLDDLTKRWYENADQIAQFLSKANPDHWPLQEMKDMLYNHLRLTTDEVMAHKNKEWEKGIKIFDKVYDQALAMARGLADGIIEQYSDKF